MAATALWLALLVLPGFHSSPKLAPAASFVAKKPITVLCANTLADWQHYGRTSQEFGAAIPGDNVIKLAPSVCKFLVAKIIDYDGFGASLLVLVHESIHARGESDEGITDCAAVHEMPRVAVKYFKVKPGKYLRGVMANAWNYRYREAPPYRTVC